MKKLYKISQIVNQDWDTYDSAVVCANSNKEAQYIPLGECNKGYLYRSWAKPEDVDVEYLGIADVNTKLGIICASFINA